MKEIIACLEEKLEFEKKSSSNLQEKINNLSNTVPLLESAIKEMEGMEKETAYLKRVLEADKNALEYSESGRERHLENISVLNGILENLKERTVSELPRSN